MLNTSRHRPLQKHGYHNVCVNEICASCGVTTGSFYYHFVNNESVILAYYSSCLDTASKTEESVSKVKNVRFFRTFSFLLISAQIERQSADQIGIIAELTADDFRFRERKRMAGVIQLVDAVADGIRDFFSYADSAADGKA